jgi:small subunit ribosomal protein S3
VGQKINPIGFRVAVTKDWRSRWFASKASFSTLLHEDLKLRDYVKQKLLQAAVSRIQIERFANRVRITIHTARPGLVLGRKGTDLDTLKAELIKLTGQKDVLLDVVEIKKPELDAQLIAENVALQIERRISFRRAMKKAMQTAMELGGDGIRLKVSGRLNQAELARMEQYRQGKVPLHTLRANVTYGFAEANTVAGKIGVKCWVCLPENSEESSNAADAKTGKVPKGAARKPRGKRPKM